ncbi:EAL domain-containing protein [Photobacterium sanguinicancri]|uniref:EAL domain-containing protein n=1 Tax=Photobacterium sanguinicancri TaxID=875932 RepID=UPI0021C3BA30|nr:EAL domain-containing protein [Photobacterium sanguinicancri]
MTNKMIRENLIVSFFTFLYGCFFEVLVKKHSIRKAIANNEFKPYYQPIMCTKTGCALGYEVLARWVNDNDVILPDRFIHYIEKFGLLDALTSSLLEQAYEELDTLPKQQWLSVNISPSMLESDFLYQYFKSKKFRYAERIKLEITERILISDFTVINEKITALSDRGFEFSIDDFGEGYCDISYISKLNVNTIKVDKSLVIGMSHNIKKQKMLRAILALCQQLNLQVIVEGVEDKETSLLLSSFGISKQQGFFYEKPKVYINQS